MEEYFKSILVKFPVLKLYPKVPPTSEVEV
jgi:hypothetical protein